MTKRLEDGAGYEAIFDLDSIWEDSIGRYPRGARGGDMVGKSAITLAETGLITSLEVFMLDRNCKWL